VPLAVAVGNDRQFGLFTAALGVPALAEDVRFATNPARVAHRVELIEALHVALRTDSAAGWTIRLQAVGIPCGPVNDVGAALDLAARLGMDPISTFPAVGGDPAIATLASPLRLRATPVRYDRPPPALGADSAEVRSWLAAADAAPLT
jgi:crotonobetainyl-CoA:carnitine CoA-transferase CaiB-like acyl-CoA transferase